MEVAIIFEGPRLSAYYYNLVVRAIEDIVIWQEENEGQVAWWRSDIVNPIIDDLEDLGGRCWVADQWSRDMIWDLLMGCVRCLAKFLEAWKQQEWSYGHAGNWDYYYVDPSRLVV